MTTIKIAISTILLMLGPLLFGTSGVFVFAADEQGCTLSKNKFSELAEIQNGPFSDYAARVREELKIRKELLSSVVDCATEETHILQASFNKISTDNDDVSELKSKFSSWFADTINYYELQNRKIDDLGLQGSRDFAKNFSTWRESNYKSQAKTISNFIIWAQNQELIQIAQVRIKQVGRTIDFFRVSGEATVQEPWREVNEEFKNVLKLNDTAKNNLRIYGPPDNSIESIRESLEALSATYQKLFDLINAINKHIAG